MGSLYYVSHQYYTLMNYVHKDDPEDILSVSWIDQHHVIDVGVRACKPQQDIHFAEDVVDFPRPTEGYSGHEEGVDEAIKDR